MRGGKRAGAGRKPGAATKRNREIADAAARAGEMPLEYMLRVMRDKKATVARRDEMAKAAARFCHPALSTLAVGGVDGGPIRLSWEDPQGK